jgi:LacI family transcriptional regulator
MNLEDIAKKAGVSRSTVSRVINGESYVSEKTRERVMQIIEIEGYSPNPAARMLVMQRSQVMGVVVPALPGFAFEDNYYFPALLHGISQATDAHDYGMLLWLGGNTSDPDRFSRRILKNRLMDGLILASVEMNTPFIDQLINSSSIFVMVERPAQYGERINYVTVDNIRGAIMAVEHLLSLGRRRIATIVGNIQNIDAVDRLAGYKVALERAGIAFDEELAPSGHFTRSGGYQAMKRILPCRPDAVFAATDQMALGVIQAINEAGLQIPDDIAIVGFDDLPMALDTIPPLTTIRQPIAEKGRRAAELLFDLVEGRATEPRHIVLPVELIIRQSCGGVYV